MKNNESRVLLDRSWHILQPSMELEDGSRTELIIQIKAIENQEGQVEIEIDLEALELPNGELPPITIELVPRESGPEPEEQVVQLIGTYKGARIPFDVVPVEEDCAPIVPLRTEPKRAA